MDDPSAKLLIPIFKILPPRARSVSPSSRRGCIQQGCHLQSGRRRARQGGSGCNHHGAPLVSGYDSLSGNPFAPADAFQGDPVPARLAPAGAACRHNCRLDWRPAVLSSWAVSSALMSPVLALERHRFAPTGLQHRAPDTDCLQVVITAVWAASTVVISTFGYSTLRTGAHMADTGTEHNIELIAQVSAPHAVVLCCAVDTQLVHVQLPHLLCVAGQTCQFCSRCISVVHCLFRLSVFVCPRGSGPRVTEQLACTNGEAGSAEDSVLNDCTRSLWLLYATIQAVRVHAGLQRGGWPAQEVHRDEAVALPRVPQGAGHAQGLLQEVAPVTCCLCAAWQLPWEG